jgi:indole-3-glycerol phosphate synthase
VERGPFAAALLAARDRGDVPVIPDIKVRSPKEGDLMAGRDPVAQAVALAAAGAPALSVVTEPERFGGSLDLARAVARATGIPVLRKDFLTSPADIEASAAAGVQAVLLMYATAGRAVVEDLYARARAAGLEALVETHDAAELAWARDLGAPLVGINNRDITALERDDGTVTRTAALARSAPPGAVVVSESGIATPADAATALAAGADAVLVGTALWRAADPVACYRALAAAPPAPPQVKVCGVMNAADAALAAGLGADVIGFVVDYPTPVPWNIPPGLARDLIAGLPAGQASAIVTGGPADAVVALAERLRPSLVQLHVPYPVDETAALARRLAALGIGAIQTVFPDTPDLDRTVAALAATPVQAILIDPRTPDNAAVGGAADPALYRRVAAAAGATPVILAGGLTPDNVAGLVRATAARHIDVLSGVESAPGAKSPERLAALLAALGR